MRININLIIDARIQTSLSLLMLISGVEELIRPLVNTLVVLTDEAVEIGFDGSEEDPGHLGTPSCKAVTGVKGIGPLILLSHQTRTRAADNLLFDLLAEHFNIEEVCLNP